MKQLCFVFDQQETKKWIVQFPRSTENQLIELMSVAIRKVNKKEGEVDNEEFTSERENQGNSSQP